jgi:nucleotide-binding universal stress UspA family protein
VSAELAGPIVVGVDGSPQSRRALQWAARMSAATGRPIRAVIAWHVPFGYGGMYLPESWSPGDDAAHLLADTVDQAFPGGRPVGLRTHVHAGHPVAVLLDECADATMLVVGSRGRGGFGGLLLGSVSAECARHAPCPVLVVRDADGDSASGTST